MVAARVAGVPMPASFIASAASSSSTSLPAVSIARRSVPSEYLAGGLVRLASASASVHCTAWPTFRAGSDCSASSSPAPGSLRESTLSP